MHQLSSHLMQCSVYRPCNVGQLRISVVTPLHELTHHTVRSQQYKQPCRAELCGVYCSHTSVRRVRQTCDTCSAVFRGRATDSCATVSVLLTHTHSPLSLSTHTPLQACSSPRKTLLSHVICSSSVSLFAVTYSQSGEVSRLAVRMCCSRVCAMYSKRGVFLSGLCCNQCVVSHCR
uniref:Protein TolB n=1 Tax=Lygus hesperus TaxID=30085 RepID=A0A0A9Y5R1_LYGHE